MTLRLRLLLASGVLLATLAVNIPVGDVSARGTAAPSAAAGGCQNYQLLIRPIQGSGAAGHYGVMYRIRNISNSGCTLSGFPGVQLLDTTFTTLPTHVTWSTNLAGHHAVTLVQLGPNGTAYFFCTGPRFRPGVKRAPAPGTS